MASAAHDLQSSVLETLARNGAKVVKSGIDGAGHRVVSFEYGGKIMRYHYPSSSNTSGCVQLNVITRLKRKLRAAAVTIAPQPAPTPTPIPAPPVVELTTPPVAEAAPAPIAIPKVLTGKHADRNLKLASMREAGQSYAALSRQFFLAPSYISKIVEDVRAALA